MKWSLNWKVTAGLAAALAVLAIVELVSLRSTDRLVDTSREIVHAQHVLDSLETIMATIDDAETGQRGYLLTGEKSYLLPYESASIHLPGILGTLRNLTANDPEQWNNFQRLSSLTKEKLRELTETIRLRKDNKRAEVSRIVLSNRGKQEMDSIRAVIARMEERERGRMLARNQQWEARARAKRIIVVYGVIAVFALLLVVILFLNSETARRINADRALRESEMRTRLLVDSIQDYAILMLDPGGRILSWSPGGKKITGYAENEIANRSFSIFFTPEDIEAGVPQQELETALVSGRSEVDGWRVRKDGSRFWSNSVVVPVRDHQGQLQGFSKVMRDITQRKRAQEEIEELNRTLKARASELEAANKELEAFTYSVSHDLRAPLRHIDGFSQLLVDEYAPQLPDDVRRYIDRIQTGARQMGQLVDELLTLARIGRQEVNTQVTGLGSLVEPAVEALKMEINGRNVEWQIASLPFVECDPGLVKQVFANLLSNAVKYTRPRDPAVIEVGSIQNNGHPVIYVRDNGVGFNMKYSSKLFGVFQRLHRAEDFEGTGVGLATVQRIVHKHGGRIWAEAELDKGATFYFTLGCQEN